VGEAWRFSWLILHHADGRSSTFEPFVQRGQRQAAPQGQLQIRRVVGRETMRPCQGERIALDLRRRLVVNDDGQRA
jgi:hypothetical protein